MSKVFGLESGAGLTDILLGNLSWREPVQNITDILMGKIPVDMAMMTPGLDNLNILTAGSIPPDSKVKTRRNGILRAINASPGVNPHNLDSQFLTLFS